MSKLKLDRKKAMTILACITLGTTLYGCMPQKNETKEDETILELEIAQEPIAQNTQENETNLVEEYVDYLKEEMTEVENYASDKWNSEEVTQKREDVKERLKTLVDFAFNGEKINGVTFSELKEEEKERILEEINILDNKIDEYIPNYKERLNNWFQNKKEDAKEWVIDKSVDLKILWEDYQNEVEEEYRNRKL